MKCDTYKHFLLMLRFCDIHIGHRIGNQMRVDATLGFDLEGHFQGHKGQIFFSRILCLMHSGFPLNFTKTS